MQSKKDVTFTGSLSGCQRNLIGQQILLIQTLLTNDRKTTKRMGRMPPEREIKRGVIHCADTPASMDIGAAEITVWHKKRGWTTIGYHHVIRRDGTLEKGRDLDGDGDVLDEVGAHARGFNADSIGIVLVGGKPRFNFTMAQLRSLFFLMDEYEMKFPDIEWDGHYELDDGKQCPMFDVNALREYR
jgi:N-acetylmuramoyl-L-alanine amidase